MEGWIKLHRCLMEKPIWLDSTPEQKVILVTLLMMANHKGREWEWKGEKYRAEPGQFVTSLKSISLKSGVGISIQNVRTALKRFEKYEFLTSKSTNKNRLITIVNWHLYQKKDDEVTSNLTSNQQAPNKHLTTNKNVRMKECKNKDIVVDVIDYLNSKADRSYKTSTKKTQQHINARVQEGYSAEDLKQVVDKKVAEWGKNPEMSKYLRPETLFGPKFESYINEPQKNDYKSYWENL